MELSQVVVVESSCDGRVQLCWWNQVVMVEYSCIGGVEVSGFVDL